MKNQNIAVYTRYSLALLILLVLQQTFIPYIEILHFAPDIVLIALYVIALRLGQIPATIFGFASGLLTDLFVGEVIGISSLAKTISAFIAGYYFDEEKIKISVLTPKFIAITLFCAFIHNIIYLFAYIRTVDLDILQLFLTYGIGATAYTSLVSILPVLFVARTQQKIKVS